MAGKMFKYCVAALVASSFCVSPAMAIGMKEAVRLAIKNNPKSLSQLANQRATAHELEASRRQFLPNVTLNGEVGKEYYRQSHIANTGNNLNVPYKIGVTGTLLLLDGYVRANNVYRNAARVDAAIYNLLATSETLALSAVEAYVDVVRHRELLYIAGKNITRHTKILRQIRQRVRGGKAPVSDRIQIEERVFAAKAVKVEIEKAYQDVLSKFRKVVGKEPGRRMKIPNLRSLPRSVQTLVRASIDNNYELKSAQKSISETEYQREASQGALAPRLSLEGSTSYGLDRGGARRPDSEAYVGLKLSWKLYDGGVNNARNSALAERVGQAKYQRDIKVRSIREVAEQAWNSHHSGRKRNSILLNQVSANKRIVKNYKQEYQLSRRSLLDVLDAERALFNSQFQQISVRAGYRFSGFKMLATMSKLASHFGIAAQAIAPEPFVEERFVSDPTGIFNINIEPLK